VDVNCICFSVFACMDSVCLVVLFVVYIVVLLNLLHTTHHLYTLIPK
jgi:hypothetical protein